MLAYISMFVIFFLKKILFCNESFKFVYFLNILDLKKYILNSPGLKVSSCHHYVISVCKLLHFNLLVLTTGPIETKLGKKVHFMVICEVCFLFQLDFYCRTLLPYDPA